MLSPHELEIMNLLWSENRALTRSEMIELSPDKSWKPSTIHLLIPSLLKKGAIKVAGRERSGKVFAKTYAAIITPEQSAVEAMRRQSTESVTLSGIFAALVDGNIGKETLDELQRILDEKKRES